MSFTEQDMKKQMEDFAALREEFSRLESQEKAMRKQLGLPEQETTDPDSLTPNCARWSRKPRPKPVVPVKPVPPMPAPPPDRLPPVVSPEVAAGTSSVCKRTGRRRHSSRAGWRFSSSFSIGYDN